ncbi:hypothetical protein D3C71_1185370 [compost metagenome]
MCIEKTQRFARLQRFQPERGLAQLDGQRVEVNPINAVQYHLAQSVAVLLFSVLIALGIQLGHLGG